MRVVAIVQARLGSARLPGKSLMPLGGKPLVQHVLERVATVRGIDEVVLATSLNERDEPLAVLACALGFRSWRGSEHDVLGRYARAAEAHQADLVMRVTGDCPFLAPEVCEEVLETALAEHWWDYVCNDTTCSGYPDGLDCEVFKYRLLVAANQHATSHGDREHVTPWMRRHNPVRTVHSDVDLRHVKISVDDLQDMERVRTMSGHVPLGDYSFAATMRAYGMLNGNGGHR